MDLETWRKNRGFTYDKLAEFLEMRRGTVFNICRKQGCISLKNAYQITLKTGGAVTYIDLLDELEC
jgi:hypothetical protein